MKYNLVCNYNSSSNSSSRKTVEGDSVGVSKRQITNFAKSVWNKFLLFERQTRNQDGTDLLMNEGFKIFGMKSQTLAGKIISEPPKLYRREFRSLLYTTQIPRLGWSRVLVKVEIRWPIKKTSRKEFWFIFWKMFENERKERKTTGWKGFEENILNMKPVFWKQQVLIVERRPLKNISLQENPAGARKRNARRGGAQPRGPSGSRRSRGGCRKAAPPPSTTPRAAARSSTFTATRPPFLSSARLSRPAHKYECAAFVRPQNHQLSHSQLLSQRWPLRGRRRWAPGRKPGGRSRRGRP